MNSETRWQKASWIVLARNTLPLDYAGVTFQIRLYRLALHSRFPNHRIGA